VSSDGEKSVLRRQTRPLFGEGVKSRGVDMCGRFRSLQDDRSGSHLTRRATLESHSWHTPGSMWHRRLHKKGGRRPRHAMPEILDRF
jgi:hypothetical protein